MTPGRSRMQKSSNTSSNAKLGNSIKKVGIDLSLVDNSPSSLNPTQTTLPVKNYGGVSEQIHKQQQNRKENLDKLLLQMQIEKEKMGVELQKIGEFPKTTQQMRRKEELATEMNIIQSNMANIKNKLKMLKP